MNLTSNFEYVVQIAYLEDGNMHQELQGYWKAVWKGFNLPCLHFQYRKEKKDLFLLIKGNEYLFLYADANEVCTQVVKIADVIGLEGRHLQVVRYQAVKWTSR